MASHSFYISEAVAVRTEAVELLKQLLATQSPINFETRSRYGELYLALSHWTALRDWLKAQVDLQATEPVELSQSLEGLPDYEGQPFDIESLSRANLLSLAKEHQIEVVGTGANGYITREDVLNALQNKAEE